MIKILSKDIDLLKSEIMNDEYLKILLSQKCAEKDHTKNIFNFEPLITLLIDEYLIPFIATTTKSSPHTYAAFINEAYPKGYSGVDTKERKNFDSFYKNITNLQQRTKSMTYVPPFISYITNSIFPINEEAKKQQKYRNYTYMYFNARTYSSIMNYSNYIPFFQKDVVIPKEHLHKFYSLFTNIQSEPKQSDLEQFISQYYVDKYFNIYLFSRTLNAMAEENKTSSIMEYCSSSEDYECHLNYFLFLCTLLQEAPSIYIKQNFFNSIFDYFFCPGKNRFTNLFTSTEACFKQCAAEIILCNKIIFPYIVNQYTEKLDLLVQDKFSVVSPENLYRQFSNIIDADPKSQYNKKFLSTRISELNQFLLETPFINENIYAQTYKAFYNSFDYSIPFLPDQISTCYQDILSQINFYTEIKMGQIKTSQFKNANFTL